MPIINLEQGTPEWHKYRSNHIMATDTPVILGNNPWVTPFQRWQEKLGLIPPPEMNLAMREGQRKEPIARVMIEEMLQMEFIPVVYQSDTNPWMAASLDGLSKCGKYIIEIKCPSKYHLHGNNNFHGVPRYYRDQMDHQSICPPGILANYFCTWFPGDKHEPIRLTKYDWLNEEYESVKQEIIEKGYQFYVDMCTLNPPVEWKLKERK